MKESFNIYHHFGGAFVPSWLLSLSEIGAGAKLTYALLAQQANSNGFAQLNFRMLEGTLGESEGQIARHLLELERVNLIHAKRGNVNTEDVRIFFPQHEWYSGAAEPSRDSVAPEAGSAGGEAQPRLFAAEPAVTQTPVDRISNDQRPASPFRKRKRKRWFGRPRSRHTLETCLAFITYQKEVLGRRHIYDPQGLAESIFHTGEQDDEIEDWLAERADAA
jgi:hypothetical protein